MSLGELYKKGKKLKSEKNLEQEETKRVLAPFLSKHVRKQKATYDVKAEYENIYAETKPKEVLARLGAFFVDILELPTILNETSEIMKSFTKSDGVSLYMIDPTNKYIILSPKYTPRSERHIVRYPIEPGTTVAAYVAYNQEFIATSDVLADPRFPLGIPGVGKVVKSVLCLPVLKNPDGACLAVIELYRTMYKKPYSADDLKMAVAVTGWMGAAIHQNHQKTVIMKEQELVKYLINLVQLLFSGVIAFEKYISDIILFAKTSVGAERGTFYVFLGDIRKQDEIVAEVYDEGIDGSPWIYKKKTKQRLTKHSPSLAAQVARTGTSINLRDAYEDERFNKFGDMYGFRTRSVVCVPVKNSLRVLGVLKLVNKLPYFKQEDEELIEKFASFSLIGCQYNLITTRLKKQDFRNLGSQELVELLMKPSQEDLESLTTVSVLKPSQIPRGYFGFDWFIGDREKHAPHYILFSFVHVLGPNFYDFFSLCEFILMVKKSYRANPYHNFVHAFTVFHCTFNIIEKNMSKFDVYEKAALLIASYCHDADHFGCTNSFLLITDNWLSELYEESCLENHHIDICMSIIQSSNLFARLRPDEFSLMNKLIRSLILATDLAAHFRSRGLIMTIVKHGAFDWGNSDHRQMYMNVTMTCSDISGQCKPFFIARKITECLYKEFYYQGDEEKKLGFEPLAIMDRNKIDSIPSDQIRFLTIVCIPCLEILCSVLPNTEPLLKMCMDLRDSWRLAMGKHEGSIWRPEEATYAPTKTTSYRLPSKCGKFSCERPEADFVF